MRVAPFKSADKLTISTPMILKMEKMPDELADMREPRVQQPYILEDQIGFILRRAHQRASAIFADRFKNSGLSAVQFAALVKIRDEGRVSQNLLGRLISMDPTTIMGVVNRLVDRNLARRLADTNDRRRTLISITSDGLRLLEDCESIGFQVTSDTLAGLEPEESAQLMALLSRIVD